MKKLFSTTPPFSPHTTWPLAVLLIFTIIAGIGYATFGRHPELLQHVPHFAAFFGVSFTFFAQGHVLLSAFVLVFYLIQKTQIKWLAAFAAIYAISLSSELTGTATGMPFGPYAYTGLLGAKWFNLVPVLIPLSWFTMTLPAFYLSYVTFPSQNQAFIRIVFAALLLTLWDLALDPAMSYLTPYWQWSEPGAYYGMPLINLLGWFVTGLVLMTSLHILKIYTWMGSLSFGWMIRYYLLVLLLPLVMVIAGGLWLSAILTSGLTALCVLFISSKFQDPPASSTAESNPSPGQLETEQLKDYFSNNSRSFSFAARFFSPEQYRLVTRLYAFCRTTDDIADIYAINHGKAEAEKQLSAWEQKVHLSYQGVPSNIIWLDELMNRSVQSGLPFQIVSDLIAGVRSDLDKVEIQSMPELQRYTYCVASVVGIWLCYLFGVREKKVLDRAAALGRAMQITNIIRDVGEDLRVQRIYLPADLMDRHGVEKEDLLAMEGGRLPITEAYKILIEDLMEKAEADYNYAFRGLSAIPISFARAAAVASEIYKGIHRAVRRNRYNNFQRRAFTRWYEKIFLANRALSRLRKTQKRPFIPANQSLTLVNNEISQNGKHHSLLALIAATLLFFNAGPLTAQQSRDFSLNIRLENQQMERTNLEVLQLIRSQYIAAVTDEQVIEQALLMLDSLGNNSAILQAYEAAFGILKAKHTFWPHKKMKYLNDGLPRLDALIAADPLQVEIRYLRLLSCYYLPAFLGRGDTVKQDVKALAALLPTVKHTFSSELYYTMVAFISSSKHLTHAEKHTLDLILGEAQKQPYAAQ